ncbi:MAG: MFS transporter [Armatimonadetes bacterium]|nr:MFS transporter [Armatimonadota bacterium]
MQPATRLRDFLGLQRSMLGLLSMVILVGMGEHMAEQFLPLYLQALGAGFVAVGTLNALDNLLSALYSFPGGYLSDRLGTKRALLVFNLFAMLGYVVVIVVPSWPAVFVGAIFFLSWTAISLPASMSLVSKALPSNKHTMGVTMHSLVRRLPMALGPMFGGALVDHYGPVLGVRIAFGVALGMAVVAVVMQETLIVEAERPPGEETTRPDAEHNPLRVYAHMPPALKSLLVSDILVRFCEQIPYAFVVIWATESIVHPVTKLQFGTLRSIEMATAILIYLPVAYFADKTRKKPFVVVTFAFFTCFPLFLMHCQGYTALAAAFVLRGLKEFGEPTRKTLIMDLAPEGRKAQMFGLYYLMRDVVVSVGAFSAGFLWSISPQTNLWTAFACGAAGTLWFAIWGKDLGWQAEPTPTGS